MQFDTYLFGTVEVSPEKVITFPNGLVGFEKNRLFMLAHEEGKGEPASYTLQSLEDPALAFGLVDPTRHGFTYELALTDAENALLQSPAPEDVAVMQLLFQKGEGGSDLTLNLRAPLVINTRARVGIQKVMETMSQNIILSNLTSNV